MKCFLIFLLFIYALFIPSYAQASGENCPVINANSETVISSGSESSNRTVCVRLKNIVPAQLHLFSAPLLNTDDSNAMRGYDYEVRLADGTLLHSSYTHDVGEVNHFENAGQEIIINLTPTVGTYSHDIEFLILNGNENNEFSIVHIGGRAIVKQSAPPVPPGQGECDPVTNLCNDPLSGNMEPFTTGSNSELADASQCTADNRPPSPLPYKPQQDSVRKFDLNNALRQASAYRESRGFNSWQMLVSPAISTSGTIYHMYSNFRNESDFNFKSIESPWTSGEDFGNFFYGAYMQQMGFSLSQAQRFSAAYQPISEEGFSLPAMSSGLYNYFSNSGDGDGDPEMVERGWSYGKEVFEENHDTSSQTLCVDSQTIANFHSGGGGGAGGGSGGGDSYGGIMHFTQTCWDVCTGGGCVTYLCEVIYWMVP